MIHTNRIVTVGEQESIIDRPIVLYRGDREVEIEFTLVGNEFTFSEEGNVIKSVNASHGQLVLNTPSGEHMFSELAECHEGKVVFVVTKEMIDEFIEMGFYSFQIRLYDSAEMKSRVTFPPVMNGFDIRNPIAAEDETNVVDQGLVGYARVFKDQSNEELPTFDWTGAYNKTEWAHHDLITENKMNKIEDALYSINADAKKFDVEMRNTLDQVTKDADKYIKEHIAEVENDVEEFERNINTGVERFKIDTNAAMTAYKNEVNGKLENFNATMTAYKNEVDEKLTIFNSAIAAHENEVNGELENFNAAMTAHKNEVDEFVNQFDTSHLSKNGCYTAPGGLLLQWGVLSVFFNGVDSCLGECNFNIPFKNEVFTLFIDTNAFGVDAGGNAASFDIYSIAYHQQLNKFKYEIKTISGDTQSGTVYFSWFAIGM